MSEYLELTERDVERFLSHVQIGEPDQCWPWTASTIKGCGQFEVQNHCIRSPRVAYYIGYGKWPEVNACHTCDNPLCCNYHHIFDGTQMQNIEDARQKGRIYRGERHYKAKLTENDVREIRILLQQRPKLAFREIGRRYKVDGKAISGIAYNMTWKHVK